MTDIGGKPARTFLLSGAFWTDTAERIVRAVAAADLALIGATHDHIDWGTVGFTSLYAAIVTLLLCLAARPVGDKAVPNASFLLTSGRPESTGIAQGPTRVVG